MLQDTVRGLGQAPVGPEELKPRKAGVIGEFGRAAETVAGLIFTGLGRMPKVGDTVRKNGYKFTVDRADRRRIYRVRVANDPE